jgi:hypothetical protein
MNCQSSNELDKFYNQLLDRPKYYLDPIDDIDLGIIYHKGLSLRHVHDEFKKRCKVCEENIKYSNIKYSSDGCYYHNGFIEYLLCALKNNLGIVIGPWDFWTIILSNLNLKNNNEIYNNDENVDTANIPNIPNIPNTEFDITMLVKKIKATIFDSAHNIKLYTELYDSLYLNYDNIFIVNNCKDHRQLLQLMQFMQFMQLIQSIQSIQSIQNNISFTELNVESNYKTTNVKINGSLDDWKALLDKCNNLLKLQLFESKTELKNYLINVSKYIGECIYNFANNEFWKTVFEIKNGKIEGHIKKIFADNQIESNVMLTKIKFQSNILGFGSCIRTGVFSSNVHTFDYMNYLIPNYNFIITDHEINKIDSSILLELEKIFNFLYLCTSKHHKMLMKEKNIQTYFVDLYNWVNFTDSYNSEMKMDNPILHHIRQHIGNKADLDLIDLIENKNLVTALYDYINMLTEHDTLNVNFWMSGWNYYMVTSYKWNVPIVTTESWLHGIKKQRNEGIDNLIIKNMHHIISAIVHSEQLNSNCINPFDNLISIILSTYNIVIYQCFFHHVYYSSNINFNFNLDKNTNRDKMLCDCIIKFIELLLVKIFDSKEQIWGDSIEPSHFKSYNIFDIYHSSFIANYLIDQLIQFCNDPNCEFFEIIKNNIMESFNKLIDRVIDEVKKDITVRRYIYGKLYISDDTFKNGNYAWVTNMLAICNKFQTYSLDYANTIFKEKLYKESLYIKTFELTHMQDKNKYSNNLKKLKIGKSISIDKLLSYYDKIENAKPSLIKILDFLVHCHDNIREINIHDVEHLKNHDNEYSIWTRGKIFVKNNDDQFNDDQFNFNRICEIIVKYDDYNVVSMKNDKMFNLVLKNFDELFNFIKLNNKDDNFILLHIFWTLKSDIIAKFIIKYISDPYDPNDSNDSKYYIKSMGLPNLFSEFDSDDVLNNIPFNKFNLIIKIIRKLHLYENIFLYRSSNNRVSKFDPKIFKDILDDLLNDTIDDTLDNTTNKNSVKLIFGDLYSYILDTLIPKSIKDIYDPSNKRFARYNTPPYVVFPNNDDNNDESKINNNILYSINYPNYKNPYGIYISMLHRIGKAIIYDYNFDTIVLKNLVEKITENSVKVSYPSIDKLVYMIWHEDDVTLSNYENYLKIN